MRFCSLRTIPAGEMHEKTPPTAARAPRDRRLRRTLGERSGCTLAAGNSTVRAGLRVRANSVARAHAIEFERGDASGRLTGRCRSSARASRHRPASLPAAAGRSPDVRRSEPGRHCKRRGTRRAVAIKQLAKIGGAGENVVARIVSVGAEVVAGAQSGVCLRHDLHQPHCALLRNVRANLPPLSTCITARIHCSGTPKRLDASVTKAAKGLLDISLARCMAGNARSACAESLNSIDDAKIARCTPSRRETARLPSCSRPSRVKR